MVSTKDRSPFERLPDYLTILFRATSLIDIYDYHMAFNAADRSLSCWEIWLGVLIVTFKIFTCSTTQLFTLKIFRGYSTNLMFVFDGYLGQRIKIHRKIVQPSLAFTVSVLGIEVHLGFIIIRRSAVFCVGLGFGLSSFF